MIWFLTSVIAISGHPFIVRKSSIILSASYFISLRNLSGLRRDSSPNDRVIELPLNMSVLIFLFRVEVRRFVIRPNLNYSYIILFGSGGGTRTHDQVINSHLLYH